MAHRVDDLNYITESGKRLFKDSPIPGTTVSRNWLNAYQEEVCQVVEAAGLTLAPSAVDDAAAGWTQLRQAILRLSHNQPNIVTTTVEVTTLIGVEIVLSPETRLLLINDDGSGPYPYAPFSISNLEAYANRRELIVHNISTVPKVFSLGDGRSVDLMPGQPIRIYHVSLGGTPLWRSLSGEERVLAEYTLNFPVSAHNVNAYGYVVNRNGVTDLLLPAFYDSTFGSAEPYVELLIPTHLLPWVQALPPSPSLRKISISIISQHTASPYRETWFGELVLTPVSGNYIIQIYPPDGSNIATYCYFPAQVISIRNVYP